VSEWSEGHPGRGENQGEVTGLAKRGFKRGGVGRHTSCRKEQREIVERSAIPSI